MSGAYVSHTRTKWAFCMDWNTWSITTIPFLTLLMIATSLTVPLMKYLRSLLNHFWVL